MHDVGKRFTVLENASGFARLDVTRWRHGMFIHWGSKLCVPPNAVRAGMPSALVS